MSEIKQFIQLLESYLQNKDKTIQVSSFSTTNLVPAGDNYGGILLAVEVNLNNGEKKQLVAKLPPKEEKFKQLFNIWITFKKEAEFYSYVVPTLHRFQTENSIEILDLFADYYGHRLSLFPELNTVDDDACLIMDNLKYKGFSGTKRSDLYDLATAGCILRNLAHFHALPIALRLRKPQVFERILSIISLTFSDTTVFELHAIRVNKLVHYLLQEDTEMKKYTEKVEELFQHSVKQCALMNTHGSDLFNTIIHCDMWIPNILLKFDEAKKPIANKLVDFQIILYGNPGNDFLFFTHTSIQPEIISEQYEKLIDIYFEEFTSKLKLYNINTGAYTKGAFLRELGLAAKCTEFYHVIYMAVTVFFELKEDDGSDNLLSGDLINSVGAGYAKQLKTIIMNWVKYDWL